ncbi:hypothetical protein IMCC20628_02274 [Hoeflea sp. IMCC20628]|uniref:hypothetical protein n=1 Tax=Hoeflea sp. IMCC20628 TaxID=1620421 RepID=UPI00063AD25B|nr:hypothetical protein [Hoeflea sp. IMCC20628]AKI00973.1 hypothetical protein IMCC20628_02274 [Hoeflea sp. IMCC20628]
MTYPAPKILLVLAGLIPAMMSAGFAQDASMLAETVPDRVLFVTSGGFWQDQDEPETEEAAPETSAEAGQTAAEPETVTPPAARGYYRLIAIRGEDNKSLVYLQQIALTPQGPESTLTIGLDEINALGGYVTDIRPEDSTGAASQPGFAAYIYLKTDPKVIEPDTWSVYIDELGDIRVEQSSN